MVILNLGSGRFPLERAVNLDRENGWHAPYLPFQDQTISAVTVSHFLMYLNPTGLRIMLDEIHRVMHPGVVRITEDDCRRAENRWHDAVYHCRPGDTIALLERAGFVGAAEVAPHESLWKGPSLIQRHHGEPPKVFHVEALRPS